MGDLLHSASNHFELFSLPVQYPLDRQLLHARFLKLTRLAHPDFAGSDPDDQLRAMDLAARINEGFAILSDDLRRAEYLLSLKPLPTETPRLPQAMIERVFELREALAIAITREDEVGVTATRDEAHRWLDELMAQLPGLLDTDPLAARQHLAAARYIRKVIGF